MSKLKELFSKLSAERRPFVGAQNLTAVARGRNRLATAESAETAAASRKAPPAPDSNTLLRSKSPQAGQAPKITMPVQDLGGPAMTGYDAGRSATPEANSATVVGRRPSWDSAASAKPARGRGKGVAGAASALGLAGLGALGGYAATSGSSGTAQATTSPETAPVGQPSGEVAAPPAEEKSIIDTVSDAASGAASSVRNTLVGDRDAGTDWTGEVATPKYEPIPMGERFDPSVVAANVGAGVEADPTKLGNAILNSEYGQQFSEFISSRLGREATAEELGAIAVPYQVSAYLRNGRPEEAIAAFVTAQRSGKVDPQTLTIMRKRIHDWRMDQMPELTPEQAKVYRSNISNSVMRRYGYNSEITVRDALDPLGLAGKLATRYFGPSAVGDAIGQGVQDAAATEVESVLGGLNHMVETNPEGTGFMDWLKSDAKMLLLPAGIALALSGIGGTPGRVIGVIAALGGAYNLYNRYNNLTSNPLVQAGVAEAAKGGFQDMEGVAQGIANTYAGTEYGDYADPATILQGIRDAAFVARLGFADKFVDQVYSAAGQQMETFWPTGVQKTGALVQDYIKRKMALV